MPSSSPSAEDGAAALGDGHRSAGGIDPQQGCRAQAARDRVPLAAMKARITIEAEVSAFWHRYVGPKDSVSVLTLR